MRPDAFPTMPALAALAGRCDEDPSFKQWARGFDGVLAFQVDDVAGWMRVQDGTVTSVGAGHADVGGAGTARPTIRIAGAAADWQPVFDGQQGGLHRAWRHQRLRFDGDQSALMRHYKMIWRLGTLLCDREVMTGVSS